MNDLDKNTQQWNQISVLVLEITLFLALASHLSSSIHMPQFFEYLARGHWIVLNKSLPETYIWSKLSVIPIWHDPNWIFEVLLSLTETNFGEVGLIVLKISALFFSISSLALLLSTLSGNAFFGVMLSVVVASGFFVSNDLSPGYFSLTLCSLFFYLVSKDSIEIKNSIKVRDSIKILLLFLLAYTAVNIDATSALILVSILPFATHRKKFLIIAVFLAFLSPPYFGLQIIDALRAELNSFNWDVLLQRRPANVFDFRFAFLLLIWMLVGIVAKKQQVFDKTLKLLLFFAALSSLAGLASTNFIALALVSTAVLLAKLWNTFREDTDQPLAKGLELLQANLSKLSPIGIIWVLIAICIITIRPLIAYPVSYALLPKLEIDTALNRGLKLPLYHDSFVGSYLTYRFATAGIVPSEAVLTTPLAQVYSSSFDARTEHLAQSLNPLFFKSFDFIAPKSVICRQSEPLYSVLLKDPNWKLIVQTKDLFGWAFFERQ